LFTTFLGKNSVIRIGVVDSLNNAFFSGKINIRDKIIVLLFFYLKPVEFIARLLNDKPCIFCCTNSNIK